MNLNSQIRENLLTIGSVIFFVGVIFWGGVTFVYLLIKAVELLGGTVAADVFRPSLIHVLIGWVPILATWLFLRLMEFRSSPEFAVQQQRRSRLKLVETMALEYITPEFIAEERNIEVRNALIRRLGMDNYLKMVKARQVAKDDWGELYHYSPPGDGITYAAVKVLNSTKEPDGTFKEYWLRVPGPGSRQPESFCQACGRDISSRAPITAKEAIAWTFSLCPHHYNPQMVS